MNHTKLQIAGVSFPLGMSLYLFALLLLLLALTYFPLLLPEPILDAFVREDQVFETLSAVYLLLTAVFFFIAWRRADRPPHDATHTWLKRLSYLGLALFFIVAAGEEISWGQRLLGIETPEAVKEISYQDEINLHNLDAFQGEDAIIPFSLSQAFVAFAFLFGIIVPGLSLLFAPAHYFFNRFMPIIPLGIGLFFAVNYVYQKFMIRFLRRFDHLYLHPTMEMAQGLHEIREHGYAFVFMLAAFHVAFVKLSPTAAEKSS